MTFGARARIRTSAIRHNFETIKAKAPDALVMAVIKANAYGHGMLPVAAALPEADCFAVARLEEARALRAAGIDKPVALLGGVLSADDLDEALALDMQLGVHDEVQIRWLEDYAGSGAVVWLKIDTGMNRLGIHPAAARDAITRLRRSGCVDDLRLMTHFASADEPDDPTTREQLARFLPLIGEFEGDVSVANSPGVLAWSDLLEELAAAHRSGALWIRPGLSLYGISPFKDSCGADLGLEPAMELESMLMSVRAIHAGDRVGYGGTWQARADTVLGVVAIGYGDGYSRYIPTGTPVLVNGRRVPVVGRISMDLTTVDLGSGATDRVGDRVILWGQELPVEEIARHASTIPYQLVTGVTHREPALIETT